MDSASERTATMELRRPAVSPVRVQLDGGWWLVDPAFREWLDHADAPDWFDLREGAAVARVKLGDGRAVYRALVAGCTVYAKVVTPRGLLEAVLQRLGMSPARREFDIARRVWEAGVPSARPLACGVSSRGRSCAVFLSEQVEDARSLQHVWADLLGRGTGLARAAEIRALMFAVAEALTLAHAAGFVHRDLHPSNVLVRRGGDSGGWKAFILDWHGARHRAPLRTQDWASNLVQLHQHFQRRSSIRDRLRFLRIYLRRRREAGLPPPHEPAIRELVGVISQLAIPHACRLARVRDRRMRGDGRYFARVTLGGGWRARVMLRDGRGAALRHNVSNLPSTGEWRSLLVNLIAARTVCETAPRADSENAPRDDGGKAPHGEGGKLNLEPVVIPGLPCNIGDISARTRIEAWRWGLVGSPAAKLFHASHRLRHRDIDFPPAVALIEHGTCCRVDRAILLLALPCPSPTAPQGPGADVEEDAT